MFRTALILLLTALVSTTGQASLTAPEIPVTFRKFTNFDDISPSTFLSTDVFVIDPRNTLINRGEDYDVTAFQSFFQNNIISDIPCFFVHYGGESTASLIPAFRKSEEGSLIRLCNLADADPHLKAEDGVMLKLDYKDIPKDMMAILEVARQYRPQTSRLVFFTQDWEQLNVLGRGHYTHPVLGYYRLMPSEVGCMPAARYTLAGEEQLQWIFNEDTSQLAQRFLQTPSILMRPFYNPFEKGKSLDLFDLLDELKKKQAFIQVFANINDTHDMILRFADLLCIVDNTSYHAEGQYIETLKALRSLNDQNIWDDLYTIMSDFLSDYPQMQLTERLHLTKKLAYYGSGFLKELAESDSSSRLSIFEKRALQNIPKAEEMSSSLLNIAVRKQIDFVNDLNPNAYPTPFDAISFIESIQDKPDNYQQLAIWLIEYAAGKDKLDYLYRHFKDEVKGDSGTTNEYAFDELCIPMLKLINVNNLKYEKSAVFEYMDHLADTLNELSHLFFNENSIHMYGYMSRHSIICGMKNEVIDYALSMTQMFLNKINHSISLCSRSYYNFAIGLLESCVKCSDEKEVDLHFQVLDRCFELHPFSDFDHIIYNFKEIPIANLNILRQAFQTITTDHRGKIHINDLLSFLYAATKPNKEQIQEVYDEFVARLEKQKSQPEPDPNLCYNNNIDSSFYGFWKILREYNSKHQIR